MAGGMSFGSGFARGIAGAVAASTAREQRRKERAQEFQLKGLERAFEEGMIEAGDLETATEFILGEKGKKNKDAAKTIQEVLGKTIAMQKPGPGAMPFSGAVAAPSDDLQGARPLDSQLPKAPLPSLMGQQAPRGANGLPVGPMPMTPTARPPADNTAALTGAAGDQRVMEDPSGRGRRTMYGVPALSRDEAAVGTANRAVMAEGAMLQARIARARDVILPALKALNPNATLRDALVAAKVDVDRLPAFGSTRPNAVRGALEDGTPAFAIWDPVTRGFSDADTGEPIPNFRPLTGAETASSGTMVERAAKSLGFQSAADAARKGAMAQVNAKVEELRQADAKATGMGTADAKFNAPVDIPTAQTTGVTPGTTAAQVAGQTVPTTSDRERRRSIETIRGRVEELKKLVTILPRQADMIGGLMPGVAIETKMRTDRTFRPSMARLQAELANSINVMARSVGEQKGTQTEQDALRAHQALVDFQQSLTAGDTYESAIARLDQSLKGLDDILTRLPTQPVPTTPTNTPAGAPSASPAQGGGVVPGAFMDPKTGKMIINGVPIE